MISISDLKSGTIFILDDEPYEVLEAHHVMLGRGRGHLETKIKNLKTGVVLKKTFRSSDTFKEAEINYQEAKFLYAHRDLYWFSDPHKPADRFYLNEEQIGEAKKFLKPNSLAKTVIFNNQVINIVLPIKMDFKVIEAPPTIKGDTAKGGNKVVTLENGAQITAPLFIEAGDIIRVNTKTGEYVERAKKTVF